MERIKPVDLERLRFRKTLLGYDREEVDELLARVTAEIETLIRELGAARDENDRLAFELETFRNQEQTLQEALKLAQKMADETKEAAHREAGLILEETRGKADKLHAELHGKISDLRWELERLQLEKQKFLTRFASFIEEAHQDIDAAQRSEIVDTDDPDEPHIRVV